MRDTGRKVLKNPSEVLMKKWILMAGEKGTWILWDE